MASFKQIKVNTYVKRNNKTLENGTQKKNWNKAGEIMIEFYVLECILRI